MSADCLGNLSEARSFLQAVELALAVLAVQSRGRLESDAFGETAGRYQRFSYLLTHVLIDWS
jgi:hypothetical protein